MEDESRTTDQNKFSIFINWLLKESRWLFDQLRVRRSFEWAVAAGMALVVLLSVLFEASDAGSGLGLWLDVIVAIAAAVIAFWVSLLLGLILVRLVRSIFVRVPALIIVSLVGAYAAQVWIWGDNYWINWALAASVVVTILCLSSAIFLLRRQQWNRSGILKRILTIGLLLLGVGGAVWLGWLFISPGEPAVSLAGEYLPGETLIDAANPAQVGSYAVETLSYGSGTDLRRSEYGADVDLATESVNARAYVGFSGWQEQVREWYWGFDMGSLPRNAQVWYPEGDGPFPLVLVVHGNHNMTDFSEPGYRYLGELLASRGFIVASVDENFLNGSLYGKAKAENDARAWLLLKHLELWEDWNEQPDSVFYHKVDMTRIGLVGHSRGGEAVALAAAFNRMSRYPSNGRITWNFNFDIQSVIAIAPVDQQYKPGGHPTPLEDVNYLVIQGSHDGDVSSFKGIQQYERVSFSNSVGEYFKASLYIYRANHGQFNELWGDKDRGGMLGELLNQAAYLSPEEQRQITEVYVSAFLEATLHDRREYLPLFQDYHSAGDWLPVTNYISQYQDGGTLLVADFEEDADLTTTSLPGGSILGVSISSWKENVLRFRNENLKENHVVRVGWGSRSAYFGVTLPDDTAQTWNLGLDDHLVFLAADERDPFSSDQVIDFSVVLLDQRGRKANVQLSEVLNLSTQMLSQFTKIEMWDEEIFENETELVFQSVRIPLALFKEDNPSLSLELVKEIRFVFDQTASGTISLDEIGFDFGN
jgi:dienelactone hydrolase